MKSPEEFLAAMRERHGVSEEFVTDGGTFVDAIYREFDGDVRAHLLQFAESVFEQQAETERAVRSSVDQLRSACRQLDGTLSAFFSAFEHLRQAAQSAPRLEVAPVPRSQLN